MKKLSYFFVAFVTVLITLSATVQAQTLVGDWGLTSRGMGWPILNTAGTPAGNAAMGGASAPTAWGDGRRRNDLPNASGIGAICGDHETTGGRSLSGYRPRFQISRR